MREIPLIFPPQGQKGQGVFKSIKKYAVPAGLTLATLYSLGAMNNNNSSIDSIKTPNNDSLYNDIINELINEEVNKQTYDISSGAMLDHQNSLYGLSDSIINPNYI